MRYRLQKVTGTENTAGAAIAGNRRANSCNTSLVTTL